MRLKTLILALMGSLLILSPASAQVVVDVNKGDIRPMPIAVPDFSGERGGDISKVITENLERSGLFAPIPTQGMDQAHLDIAVQPRFGGQPCGGGGPLGQRLLDAQQLAQAAQRFHSRPRSANDTTPARPTTR